MRTLLALALCLALPGPARAQAPACRPEAVGALVMDLFPPAALERRLESAHRLGECRLPHTVGALGAVLAQDPAMPVRLAAAQALGRLPTLAAREPLRAALARGESLSLRRAAVNALAELDDNGPVEAVLSNRALDDALRSDALAALSRNGHAPSDGVLRALTRDAGPLLTGIIRALQAERDRSAAAIAAAAPPPPPPPPPVAPPPPPPVVVPVPRKPPAEVRVAAGPPRPQDGTPLAVTTSIIAGSVWGGGLSLLAEQRSVGVVTLLGTAGAVIGGGTAWGLTRFGVRPSPGDALWFTNATGWGTLAGLMAWAGSGSESPKLKYGLLVAGETVGVAAGIWGAHRFRWTAGEVALANSLVAGTGVGLVGVQRLRDPTLPTDVSPLVGYGTAPFMVMSAIAARAMEPTPNDLHLAVVSALVASWNTGLMGGGIDGGSEFTTGRGQGGLMAGLGLGYLAATAAGTFTEVSIGRTYAALFGSLAGNVIGRGTHMVIDPDGQPEWRLGAGVGGATMAVATFAAFRHLRPGPRVLSMTAAGATYGVLTWGLALTAASTGQPRDARLEGGMQALGVSGAIAGFLFSRHYQPDGIDQATALGTTSLGMSAGLGIAKLTTDEKGVPDAVGVLGGAIGGLAAGAVLTHHTRLRAPEVGAAFAGGGYGLLFGSLIPTLSLDEWDRGRRTAGGSWVGIPSGAVAGAVLARALDADGPEVLVPATAGVFGVGIGVGAGLAWPAPGSRPARIGAMAGPLALMGASILAEPRLRLSEGLGPSAPGLALWGAAAGAGYGWLSGVLVAPETTGETARRQRWGGVLAGASAGMASGLVLSKAFEPHAAEYVTALGAGVLGGSLGAGTAVLLYEDAETHGERRTSALALAGASLGLAGGAVAAHFSPLRAPDIGAGLAGVGYGAVLGAFIPTAGDPSWDDRRLATGGARVGLALGGIGAATAAHLTDASGAEVAVVSVGAGLGLAGGLGAGLMMPGDSSQPARLGLVVGTLSAAGLSLAADRWLRLHEGLGRSAGGLTILGAVVGADSGALLAAALDPEGTLASTPPRQGTGGLLFGAATGTAAGLVLSRLIEPTGRDYVVASAGTALGQVLGSGAGILVSDGPGRTETVAALGGSLIGLASAGTVQRLSPLTGTDALALPLGMAFGGLAGAVVPSLGEPRFPEWGRAEEGGLRLGLAGGGIAAVALRHATDVPASTVGWTALGGADGLATGAGVGLLIDGSDATQARRAGMVAGAAAGMGIGAALWPRLSLDGDDRLALGAAIAVGGWTGGWAPALAHAAWADTSSARQWGGILAGAGGTSFLASALLPPLHVEADLVWDALLIDGLLTGAGAGVGALASRRDDAPVWGLLGGGTAGLLLGGALHRSIDLGRDAAPLVTLSSLEGVWYGAWLPHLLRAPGEVTSRDQAAGVAAGALGASAMAVLASPVLAIDGRQAALTGLGSALGASIAGGSAMLSSLDARRETGLLLGGTTLGLATGALLAPRIEFRRSPAGYGLAGAGLGLTEGLVFAWAGRGEGNRDYAGAALVGAGVGTTLGLAGAAYPHFTLQRGLAAAGFAAWGAWMGSFSGALVSRDPHEVTLGGLAGANAGFIVGYGLVRSELVEPRDFGWLSLAGAAGTVAGGGIGAALSTSGSPRPILAGLAIGPAVGMLGGALILPTLRKMSTTAALYRAPRLAGMRFELPSRAGSAETVSTAPSLTSADVLEKSPPRHRLRRVRQTIDQVVGVGSWMPMVGSLPPAPGSTAPPAFIIGAAGTLR